MDANPAADPPRIPVTITDHALERLRERCGVAPRDAVAFATRAFYEGKRAADLSDFWRKKQLLNDQGLYIIHRDSVFVFALEKNKIAGRAPVPRLITVHRRDHRAESRA